MQKKYDEIMQEIDSRMAGLDLNKKNIVTDCRAMIHLLKEKLAEMKVFLQSHSFKNEVDEIIFFKYQKPTLLGRLIYFYKILRIESQRPLETEELDKYYEKQQLEQKLFFDRHVSFFQYYRSGSTYQDTHYFLRGRQYDVIDVDICPFDENFEFSTGYDQLVARIIAMELLYAFLSFRRTYLQNGNDGVLMRLLKMRGSYQWTGSVVELVELMYSLDEVKCINNGEITINELTAFFGTLFDIDIRDSYGAFSDIKKRKDESRTYFLDKLRERLNKRMERDDDKERKRR
ncbi:RteC domain-containing protein [Parabacteroides gordonii]|uniref:RteC protein n=1 Tax=Parabacteroides gordonii MS-1 = DSM 23371 TaxID=1203610 RepID=A0A0F5IVB6_9BACT|nr:RteC domain-containing protein [Parabacteroides gordonii]KKB49483.1 hypothetical protein HMPREF1536_04547 [Parabacteroides gordonii MS-1 = DSM 23371]MCA5585750.1 RteC domain-containing protein [Parabacteroides gordonii]